VAKKLNFIAPATPLALKVAMAIAVAIAIAQSQQLKLAEPGDWVSEWELRFVFYRNL